MRKIFFILAVFGAFTLNSCHFGEDPAWTTRILTPLINATLSMANLVDDTLVFRDSDSSIRLVYRYTFDELNMDTLLKIPDTTLVTTLKLNSIKLGVRTVNKDVTLGAVAKKGGLLGQLIIMNNGRTMPVPALSNIASGPIAIDASSLFQSVDVMDGDVTMNVYNGFPIELTDAVYRLSNTADSRVILQDTIKSLLPGQTYNRLYSLNGQKFGGKLTAEILSINSPGSGTTPVLIDTSDAIKISIVMNIRKLYSARAIFPAQNLVDINEDVVYYLNGPRLKTMNVKSGKFKIKMASTMQDSGFVTYLLPDAKYLGGSPLLVNEIVPPAKPGQSVYIEKTYDVDNYYYDLRGKNKDTYNSFWNILTLRIDSTGRMVDLSLTDSFYIYYSLYNVIPEYLEGYMGQQKFLISASTGINDIYRYILDGSLKLKDVNVGIFAENGVGAGARVTFYEIKSENSRKGVSKQLDLNSLGNPVNIQPASNTPYLSSLFQKNLNSSNSNIKDLLEIIPDKMLYNMDVTINPLNDTSDMNQFIYNSSKVKAGMDIEVPLDLSLSGLKLMDTLDFSLSPTGMLNDVSGGILTLNILNSFPLSAVFQVYFADAAYNIVDSIGNDKMNISAGVVSMPSNRVISSKKTSISVNVDENKLNRLRMAKYAIIKAELQTEGNPDTVKIYSDYKLTFKLIASLTYHPEI